MSNIKVGAVALNQIPLHWKNNTDNIIASIEEAKKKNIQILLTPELSITGYGCEDTFNHLGTIERAYKELNTIKAHCNDIIVSIGLPFLYRNSVYNGAALISNGKILGLAAKQNLANGDLHYESRWFQPWQESSTAQIEIGENRVPVGDIIFTVDKIRIGFEICEDAWVANRPGRKLANYGVDIILNPSASHFAFGKNKVREQFILDGSRAFGTNYIYTNLLGNEAGRIIYDGASIIASNGKLLNSSKRFSYKNFVITTAILDTSVTRSRQAELKSNTISNDILEVEDTYKIKRTKEINFIENNFVDLNKYEEFSSAMTLSIFDYLRKSYSKGFLVSLSGGADSSAIVTLVHLMVKFARNELGDNFAEKLQHIGNFDNLSDKDVVNKILTTVYQGTKNSSDITFNAASKLSNEVGADFHHWVIDDLVESYTKNVEEAIGRKTDWSVDDLALQNIQARVRAPGVWMLANIKGFLLVSTSNRSEAAVGYATMDGDTSGGISPLAGIDKEFLRNWLKWIEETEQLREIHWVNIQQPTAELRPQDNGKKQTDEEDLMPYNALNIIELLFVRDKKYPLEIFEYLAAFFPNNSNEDIARWVIRFFSLWSRNQWKRERYAPSFHLDETNLDPKSFFRFPILSSGFREELEEIKKLYL